MSSEITLTLTKQRLFCISATAAVVFFILSSPIAYGEVSKLLKHITGKTLAQPELAGALDWKLVLVHSLVYAVLVYFTLKYYNKMVKY